MTTGLRVGGGSMAARRRRLHPPLHRASISSEPTVLAGASSQEEYEESESEEDRALTSSAENLPAASRPGIPQPQDAGAETDDDDENATALGRVSDHPDFRPQPNAFSHPPAHLGHRGHSTNSSLPTHPHAGVSRPALSHRSRTRVHRAQPNFMSPAYQADNDAALRASLTTLLSCAAAARGLPRSKDDAERSQLPTAQAGVGPSDQPVELLLVPEYELMREDAPVSKPSNSSPQAQTSTAPSTSSASKEEPPPAATERGKRRASGTGRSARTAKKKKTAVASEEAVITPTLMTWVVSAGVLVLVSVVSFGAGYVIGREVGRQEVLAAGSGLNASAVAESTSCGREVIRSSGGSLRRFRWGGMSRGVAA